MKALFDAIREIKGAPLTQAEVDRINRLLQPQTTGPDPELIEALKVDEGLRLKAYKDTVGVWTVGYGRAHVPAGTVITREQAEAWLIEDIISHNRTIHAALPWLKNLDPVRRRVVENMHFNMGWDNPKTPELEGLSSFKNTLAHIQAGQWEKAAAGMRGSLWAKQVKGRAQRLAREMETGKA